MRRTLAAAVGVIVLAVAAAALADDVAKSEAPKAYTISITGVG